MPPTPPILRLPPELLLLIAANCDPHIDILSMRLTFKEISAASLDSFAKEYLAHLTCFMLDPDRLLRVQNILFTPQMSSKVRTVQLTLNAHEHKEPLLAPRKGITMDSACWDAMDAHANEQYDRWECSLDGISAASWNVMKSIFQGLYAIQQASVIIDVQGDSSMYEHVAPQRPQLPYDLLRLARDTGCKVSGLLLTGMYDINPLDFESYAELGLLTETLQDFGLWLEPRTRADHLGWRCTNHRNLLEATPRLFPSLRSLRFNSDSSLFADEPEASVLTGDLLRKVDLSSVKSLRLEGIAVTFEDLLKTLQTCKQSLRALHLKVVCLTEGGEPWGNFLRALAEFPILEELNFTDLYTDGIDEDQVYDVEFLLTEELDSQRSTNMFHLKPVSAEELLRTAKDGIVYISQYS